MTQEELKKQAEEVYGEAPKIDLSKVRNAGAVQKDLPKEAKKKINTAVNSAKKQQKAKFCFTEEHEVKIPTGGFLYQDAEDEDIRNGIVRIRPMTMADEETLSNQSYMKNGTTFSHLLNDCILNNFDAKNFNSYDVFFLLYTLREITYGENYKFTITCPECERKYEYEMDITKAEFKEFTEEDNIGTKKIELPVSKYTVTMRAGCLGDEEEVLRLKKKTDYNELTLRYTARALEVLDENGEPISPDDYAEFFHALPGKDRAVITDEFKVIDGAEIPNVTVTCPKCGHEEEVEIPMTLEFFRY